MSKPNIPLFKRRQFKRVLYTEVNYLGYVCYRLSFLGPTYIAVRNTETKVEVCKHETARLVYAFTAYIS